MSMNALEIGKSIIEALDGKQLNMAGLSITGDGLMDQGLFIPFSHADLEKERALLVEADPAYKEDVDSDRAEEIGRDVLMELNEGEKPDIGNSVRDYDEYGNPFIRVEIITTPPPTDI